MTPTEFADYYGQQFQNYINDVSTGERIAGRLERLAVDRWKNTYLTKYFFNEDEFRKRLKFCSLINVKSVLENGKVTQLKLAPWQLLTIAHYCLYRSADSEEKVINTISLSQSGKNGKSVTAVIIALMACLVDSRVNANIPIINATQKQANQVLDYFKQVIKQSPALQPFFKVLHSTIIYNDKNTTNKIFILTNDPERVQSLEIAIGIIDEIFLYDQNESTVLDIVKSKQDTTFNALTFVIGTFSSKEHHNYENYYLPCVNVLEGVIEDDSHFILFCSQDSETEIENPEAWIKSNPSLGVVKDLKTLVKKYNDTKIFPARLEVFKTETLNLWREVISESAFLNEEIINRCMKERPPIAPGSEIIIGLDLSSNTDLYSLTLMQEINGAFKFQFINILPDANNNALKGDIDLKRYFINDFKAYQDNNYLPDDDINPKGYIIPTTVGYMDADFVVDIITDLSNRYKITAVAYDLFNSAMVVERLINKGVNCVRAPLNITSQTQPLKFIERLILADKDLFQLQRDPFVKWQARNIKPVFDHAGNVKWAKRSRKGIPLTIDSWMALLCAMIYWWDVKRDSLSGMAFKLDNMNW